MYAVIETGGKQYRVEVGTELEVELLDVEPGQSITLDRVLLVADGAEASVGTPIVPSPTRWWSVPEISIERVIAQTVPV